MLREDKNQESPKSNTKDGNEVISKSSIEMKCEDLNINLDLDLNDALYELNLKKPKVRFHDSYSVPNATLASGINYEDNFNVNAIYKSAEYYNRTISRNAHNSLNINHHPHNYHSFHYNNSNNIHLYDSMMDYISKSQPLHGGSNLLSQYLKFHQKQDQPNSSTIDTNSKGKEPEMNSSPIYSQPIPMQDLISSSPLKPPQFMSSVTSSVSDNRSYGPNQYIIPSYKNKKHSHDNHNSHHRQYSNSIKSYSSHQEMQTSKLFDGITKTQEPINIEDDNLTNNENEPLMMKASSSTYQSSNAIDINNKKKNIKSKRRSNRPPPPSPIDSYFSSYSSSVFSGPFGSPINSSILAKTSQYIPDASLPYLVKTIDSHLINNEENKEENEYNIYNLKGGNFIYI